jgi:hypothetical protein
LLIKDEFNKELYVLVYHAESYQMFQRIVSPLPSTSKNKPSKKPTCCSQKAELVACLKESKWWLTFRGLHFVVFQERELFRSTAVRNSNVMYI